MNLAQALLMDACNRLSGALALAFALSALPCAADALDRGVLTQATTLAGQAATAGAPPGTRLEVLPGVLDPRLRLAPCERVEAYLPAGSVAWGRTRVGLRCLQGPTPWNVFLPVTVRVWAPGVVTTAALPAGTVLEAQHLQRAEIDWAASSAPAFKDTPGLLGRTLARPLAAGSAPRHTDLKARQWFAAGDRVNVVARGEGFAIHGEGQALSNGIEGRSARVRTESGRVITGQPVGERRMEMSL